MVGSVLVILLSALKNNPWCLLDDNNLHLDISADEAFGRAPS